MAVLVLDRASHPRVNVTTVIETGHKPCRVCGCTDWYVYASGRKRCTECSRMTSERSRRARLATDPDGYRAKKRQEHQRWRDNNRAHLLAYQRASKKTNRLRNRAAWYGLTLDEFTALRVKQGDRCAACNDPLDFDAPRGFTVDHDHRCCGNSRRKRSCGKCVRGLLCPPCNNLAVTDDWRILAVAHYLERGGWATSRPSN